MPVNQHKIEVIPAEARDGFLAILDTLHAVAHWFQYLGEGLRQYLVIPHHQAAQPPLVIVHHHALSLLIGSLTASSAARLSGIERCSRISFPLRSARVDGVGETCRETLCELPF
jgi:hypothetical protein